MKITKETLKQLIKEEFEAVLSEASSGLDNLKKEIARVHRKMTNDGQTPKFLVARSDISDGEIEGFKSSGRAGVSDNWKWTVYLYDQGTIQRGQKEGVEAALSENRAFEAAKKTYLRKLAALEKAVTDERRRTLEKAIQDLERRWSQLKKLKR
jgi:phage shock protein A